MSRKYSMLADICNIYHLSSFKSLEEVETGTTEKGHNGLRSFYHTVTNYLNSNLPPYQ